MHDYKQIIIVRTDLKMGKGKTAAQVAHAAILACNETRIANSNWLKEWELSGSPKIILKINDLDELLLLKTKIEKIKLPVVYVQDKGLTQLEPGTITCIGMVLHPLIYLNLLLEACLYSES